MRVVPRGARTLGISKVELHNETLGASHYVAKDLPHGEAEWSIEYPYWLSHRQDQRDLIQALARMSHEIPRGSSLNP